MTTPVPVQRFRAIWPITDHRRSFLDLITEATEDLPLVAARAHARPLRGGRWSIAPSLEVPGSGRTTTWVLIYDAPALPIRRRHLVLATTTTEENTAA